MYPHYIPQLHLCPICGKSRRWYNHTACSRQMQLQNVEKNQKRKKRKPRDADKILDYLNRIGVIDGPLQ